MTDLRPPTYLKVPRTTLWLLRDGTVTMGGAGGDTEPAFVADVAPIYIGKSLITNEQYEAFDPSHARAGASTGDEEPAVGVSFREALAYCEWYARLSNKAFRLPTEVEWEYACRADTATRFSWGDDPARGAAFAWSRENSDGGCHAIESLRANPFGLHDMLGLAWEWTSSLHAPYPVREGDGRDDLSASGPRVVRGGSFRSAVAEVGCAVRLGLAEATRRDDLGFRIVRAA